MESLVLCLCYPAHAGHSRVALKSKCTSFVCSELDFQQVVLSKQEIEYFGVETCCMVESLEITSTSPSGMQQDVGNGSLSFHQV